MQSNRAIEVSAYCFLVRQERFPLFSPSEALQCKDICAKNSARDLSRDLQQDTLLILAGSNTPQTIYSN